MPYVDMPYADHPVFQVSDESQSIYRYVSVPQFLSLLETESLWFARADTFDDPYEGRLPQKNINELPPAHEVELPEYLIVRNESSDWPSVNQRSEIEAYRKSAFVNCWHQVNEEKDVLWRANLDSDNGVVIKSTVNKLKNALSVYKNKEVWLGEVNYIDYQNEKISVDNTLSPIVHKRKTFKDERELRAVMTTFPNDKHPGYENTVYGQHLPLNWKEQDPGKYIDIHIDCLIEEVRTSPTSNSWLHRTLTDTVSKYDFDFPVAESSLSIESPDSRWKGPENSRSPQ